MLMHRLLLFLNIIMLLLVIGLGYLVVGLLWERGAVPELPAMLQPVVMPTAVSAQCFTHCGCQPGGACHAAQ